MAVIPTKLIKQEVKDMTGSEIPYTLEADTEVVSVQAIGGALSLGFATGVYPIVMPDGSFRTIASGQLQGGNLYLLGESSVDAGIVQFRKGWTAT